MTIPPPPDYAPTAGAPVEWWRLPEPATTSSTPPQTGNGYWQDRYPIGFDILAKPNPPQSQDSPEGEPEEQPAPAATPTLEATEEDPAATPEREGDPLEPAAPAEPWVDPAPGVAQPGFATFTSAAPRHDLAARRRQILYSGSAAATGWWLGIGPWCHQLMTYYGQGDVPQGLTAGAITLAAALPTDMYARRWRHQDYPLLRALGWAARVPLAAAVLAVCLYTPDALI
ncbi:hypothetical protein ACIQGZ_17065 [Streptomyces sp. NPDC092296]|uniref:hypothetical protein n=1 Tax=Streptomyces sp. NPDC092296 TaxID=3366012 RepID=UPI0037FB9CB8